MYIWIALALVIGGGDFQKQLDLAGDNRLEIEHAIRETPESQKKGMAWLLTHMPEEDLKLLTGEFLLTNCNLAYEAWENAPWKAQISEEVFFDCILPYANVNERREDWRTDFRNRFSKVVAKATTPTEATILLNTSIYDLVDVHYSTERPKADQSPYESIEAGMASCSGLSILLIDACRSVGIPARFTGTPLWYNESGNHSWIEFWDDGWHYTEANTDTVDSAWFDGSAAKATKGHPMHAIFAVTWNKEDKHFPLVWLPDVQTYGAVDVTDRYVEEQKTVLIPVRVRTKNIEGKRESRRIAVVNSDGEHILEGSTKDERADANDHLTFMLPKGQTFTFHCKNDVIEQEISSEVLLDLNAESFTERAAAYYAKYLWVRSGLEQEEQVIRFEGMSMPFWYTAFGEAPFGERSLWISLHGGGGAPEEVNTQQWENQKKLYTLEEGVYVVPRAPTNTWNMWHQAHIDPMLDQLIKRMIKKEGVDPNRVHILGYSAGGDGVYQLAPRMADRFAAAGMMAGHPNETLPEGLRNIAFALHVGADDAAYDRNIIATEWKNRLSALQQKDPSGYPHQVVVHGGKGHWMDHQETKAFNWMATFSRDPYPPKIVWVQDDVVHKQFYWLGVDEPKARTKIIASIDGQTITIHETDVKNITVYLNDTMVDLDEPITVQYQDCEIVNKKLIRNQQTIRDTLRDPKNYYTASVTVSID